MNEIKKKAINLSINYLAKRQRTKMEVVNYLEKKEIPDEIIVEVISNLENKKFINDVEFVLNYTRYALLEKHYGLYKLKNELKNKGISNNDIEDGIYKFIQEEDKDIEQIQIEQAIKLIKPILDRSVYANYEEKTKLKNKLMNKLNYRGYSMSIVIGVVDKLIREKIEIQDN